MTLSNSLRAALLLSFLLFLALPLPSSANQLPANFEESTILTGLDSPDHLLFAPDGRLFISERITGKLLVARYNASTDRWILNPQPFHTFDTPNPERRSGGLRSIAFDPNFATNGYLYAFYMKNGLLQNRVVRLRASASNPDLADHTFGNNGEELLIELPFNNSFASGSHNGGALTFGADGKLYITTGDGWTGEFEGAPVQSLSTFTGKVLRINPNGTIPTDNPFYTQTTGNYRAIYALGLRNPYSIARHPTSGKLYINEARGTNKGSIYIVEAGANYLHEGGGTGIARTPWANATAGTGGQLITGGAWYPAGGPFPTVYHGNYFAALWGGNEESTGQISRIQSETNTTVSLFQSAVGSIDRNNALALKPVITQIGPDGYLYYLLTTYSTKNGSVQRIRYTNQTTVERPQINPNGGNFTSPQSVSLTSATAGATIYYTTDGSEPTTASLRYQNSFVVGATTVIKAKAFANGMNPSSTASTTFTIAAAGTNLPPVVNAGADRTVTVGETVALDGSGSIDPDGDDDLFYDEQWTQLSGPLVEIVDDSEEVAYFTPTTPGIYRFKLSLKDQKGAVGVDEVEFTVVGVCDPLPTSIVRNGNFEAGQSDWNFYSQNGGSFVATQPAYECQQAAVLQISSPSGNVQFYQTNISLEPNTQYRLSFAAYSSRGNDMAIYLHKHTPNYTSYGLTTDRLDLTTAWQHFTIDFTTSGFNTPVSDGRLRFWLSPFAQAGDSYHFDQILLHKVTANAATATGTAPPTQPAPSATPTATAPAGTATSTETPLPTASPTATGTAAPATTSTTTSTPTTTPTTTSTVTPTPPVADCTNNPENLIRNPDFVDGQNNWAFYSNNGGSFTTAAPGYRCDQAARLQIQQSGTNIQFYQTNISLEPNTQYRLSFAAYSTSGNDMALYLHKHTAPYSSYGLSVDRIELTTEWQLFTIDFTSSGANAQVTDGRLRFWLPAYAQSGDIYWIDQVLLTKRSASAATVTPTATTTQTPTSTPTVAVGPTTTATQTPTTTPTPIIGAITPTTTPTTTPSATPTTVSGTTCTAAPGNLIRNSTFAEGIDGWNFYTNSSGRFQAVAGNGACPEVGQIEIFAPGSNIQFYQSNIPLQPNTAYRLAFEAKAQNGSDVALYLHKHTAGYNSYGLNINRIDLTASWQPYSFDFVSSGFTTPVNDARLRFWFSNYGTAGEIYQFDNLSLTPLTGPAAAAAANQHAIYLPLVNR